jgi:hypothetical protein
MPAGHCGHETSPPMMPGLRGGIGWLIPLASASAEAASDWAAEARPGSMVSLAVDVGAVGVGAVGAVVEPLGDAAGGSVEGEESEEKSEEESEEESDVVHPAATRTAEASITAVRITPSPTPRRATRWRR